ncbi:MAG TPA: MarR family winged helix-turn-helix transcriptional regulator [Egibacteraceae bacterium]|nr:MarR family winged helix-turn-helix transcriptional regulator [Egibacteraceae bacterium]
MKRRGIPREVETFIKDHLSSVAQLEILLLIHAQQEAFHSPEEVAEQLRIEPGWAAAEMERLCGHGLCEVQRDNGDRYRFSPDDPRHATVVDDLATAFSTHRVSVITLIFSTPSDSIGSFADAFKLRGDRDG